MQEKHSDSVGPGNGEQLEVNGYQSQGKQLCAEGCQTARLAWRDTVNLLKVSREGSQGLNTQNLLPFSPPNPLRVPVLDESSETSEGSPLRQSMQVSLQGGEQSGEGCRVDLRDKWEISSTDGHSSK